jgi:hypothetical protein
MAAGSSAPEKAARVMDLTLRWHDRGGPGANTVERPAAEPTDQPDGQYEADNDEPEQGDVRHSASEPTFRALSAGGLSLVARNLVSLHSEETNGLRPPSRKT